jgi:hypothetical protein
VPPVVDDLTGQVALAEGRVAGDHAPLEHHRLEKHQGRLVLVGLGRDAGLGQDAPGLLVQGRQQMHRGAVGRAAAARHLAVEGHGPQVLTGPRPQQLRGPAGQGGLQRVGREPGEEGLEGPEGSRSAAVAQAVHELDRLVAAPLGDGGVAAAAAEDGAAGVRQHRDQRVPPAVPGARVGDLGEEREQTAGWCVGHRGSSGPKKRPGVYYRLNNRSTLGGGDSGLRRFL